MSPQPHKLPYPGTGGRRKKLRRTPTPSCAGNQLKKSKIKKVKTSFLLNFHRTFVAYFFFLTEKTNQQIFFKNLLFGVYGFVWINNHKKIKN
jgi:hypothetical protein